MLHFSHDAGHAMTEQSGNDSIRFWDGKAYSETQLTQALPGLAAIVRANPVLAEQWPMWRWKSAKSILIVIGGFAAVLFVPAAALWGMVVLRYGLADIGFEPLLPAVFLGGFVLALGVFQSILVSFYYPDYRPIITVKDGVLRAQTVSRSIALEADLDDCCWYHGWASDTALAPNVPVLIFKQRAIIIRFPKQSRFGWRRRVAVGLSEEYHAIWEAFLKLADVPQIPDKWSEPMREGERALRGRQHMGR
jgi:hypothetical protein